MSTEADSFRKEIEGLFLSFVYVADVSGRLEDLGEAIRLKGKRWGWVVTENASDLYMMEPPFGVAFQGIKESEDEAREAAIGFIWAVREDLVKQCKKELAKGRAYRSAIASGHSGMSIT